MYFSHTGGSSASIGAALSAGAESKQTRQRFMENVKSDGLRSREGGGASSGLETAERLQLFSRTAAHSPARQPLEKQLRQSRAGNNQM